MTIDEFYDKLTQVFAPGLINLEKEATFTIVEKNNKDKGNGCIESLSLRHEGDCIVIQEQLLGNANNSYKGDSSPRLNEACDSIVITECDGTKYLVLIELKSSIGKAINKAPSQLKASELRLLSILNCIEGFSIDNYKLCAIATTKKPSTEEVAKIRQKREIGERLSERERLMERALVNDIVQSPLGIRKENVSFDKMPVKSEYCLECLPFFVLTVERDNTSGEFQLEDVLKQCK